MAMPRGTKPRFVLLPEDREQPQGGADVGDYEEHLEHRSERQGHVLDTTGNVL